MNRILIKNIIGGLMALLFIYTCTTKLLDYHAYYHAMFNQGFPNFIRIIAMWSIPPAELLFSILILLGSTTYKGNIINLFKIGICGSAALMTIFTIYIALVVTHIYGRYPCSCGGVISSLSWNQHLIFNLFFLGASLFGALLTKNEDWIIRNYDSSIG